MTTKETTYEEPNSSNSATLNVQSTSESVREPTSLLSCQQQYVGDHSLVGDGEGVMASGAIHRLQSIPCTSASGTMPEVAPVRMRSCAVTDDLTTEDLTTHSDLTSLRTISCTSASGTIPEVAPVWTCSCAVTDDLTTEDLTTHLTKTCSTSPQTHETCGWVILEESSVPSPEPAPLASIQESNHIADSPSPPSSARKTTSHSTDLNINHRPGVRVRLEDLFDIEAGVECSDPSITASNLGYVNPMALISDYDMTTVDGMDSKKCESQSLIPCESSSWNQGCMAGRAYQSPSATSFNTVSSEGPICRICHEGDQAGESLISPCRCTGTLKYLHTKCLEQWLQTRNKDNCELCNFEFHTRRRTRPLVEWWRHPTNPRDRRNLGVDMLCGAILSPLVMISAWLCLNGSRHYMHHEERSLEGMGLILLAAVLLAIFMTWSLLTGRYHYMVWREWSKHNQLVTVLPTPKTPPPLPSPRSHSDGLLHEVIDNNGFMRFVRIPARDLVVSNAR